MSAAGATEDPEVEVTEGPTETVTVPPPDDDAADEGGGAKPVAALSEAERETRRERRSNKMAQEREAKEEAQREAASERAERQRLSERVAELTGYVTAQAQSQQRGDPEAALKEKVTRLRREAQAHLERTGAYTKAGDRAGAEREMDLYHEKTEEAAMERYEARNRPVLERRLGELQGNIPSQELMNDRAQFASEFPWVYSDRQARAMVDARFDELCESGRPATFATVREAATAVAKRLKIGGRQDPTDGNRRRLQGVPSGEGSGGGDGAVSIPWGPAERKLAEKAYPTLDPPAAKKAWVAEMARAKRAGEY